MRTSSRIAGVPPYLFAEIDRKKDEALTKGVDVINLGVGDPDRPTPAWVVERLRQEASKPANHRYPDYCGLFSFRRAMADYYYRRFEVKLDPTLEVMTAIGSKEGLAHLVWALVGPSDVALVPDPAYPVYATQVGLAGGEVYHLPLRAENRFLPDLAAIPEAIARRAKVIFINYPNNPTGGVADLKFFREAVAFAKAYDLVLVHDGAYLEMTFDGYNAPSILEVPGAKEVAVEFYSLSKPFNMTGWRLGACVGNRHVLNALGIIKTNTDSGQWNAIQEAGIEALNHEPEVFFREMNGLYRRRRDILVEGLARAGWKVPVSMGTFYLWAPVPGGQDDATFAGRLLSEAGVIVTPGSAYGPYGNGYVRMALTVEEERLGQAVSRIGKVLAG